MTQLEQLQREDWRDSEKAKELRRFIDKSFKVKKPTMGGLERELIIYFVAKEMDAVRNASLDEAIAALPKWNIEPFIGHQCQCGNPIVCEQHNQYRDTATTRINERKSV